MSQTQRSASTSQADQPFPYWPQAWMYDPQATVQRMQRLQEDAQAVQQAAQNASVAQVEDMFEAVNTITRVLGSATQSRDMGAMIAAQPEILQCLLKVGQASQERMITVAEKLGNCSLGMAGIAPASTARERKATSKDTDDASTQ